MMHAWPLVFFNVRFAVCVRAWLPCLPARHALPLVRAAWDRYVVDAQQEPYAGHLARLVQTIQVAHAVNPNIAVEVFVHKVRTGRGFPMAPHGNLICSTS